MNPKEGVRRSAILLGVLSGILNAYWALDAPWIGDWPLWLYGWTAGIAAACGLAIWAAVRISSWVVSWVVSGFYSSDKAGAISIAAAGVLVFTGFLSLALVVPVSVDWTAVLVRITRPFDTGDQSRPVEKGSPNHILLLQKLQGDRIQAALKSARDKFARSRDAKDLSEGIAILRGRADDLREAITDVTLNRGDWSSEDRVRVMAAMLKELEWAERSIKSLETPPAEIAAPRQPAPQPRPRVVPPLDTPPSETIKKENTILVATVASRTETSLSSRIVLAFERPQVETELGPLVFKDITISDYTTDYGEFKRVMGSIVNKTDVFWPRIVLGLTFKSGSSHESEQIEAEASLLWPDTASGFILPSLIADRLPEGVTEVEVKILRYQHYPRSDWNQRLPSSAY